MTHGIKTAGLDGNVIPAPAHLAAVSIPHVDRTDMYFVDRHGVVSLDRETIPSMTPISLVSHCVDRRRAAASIPPPPVSPESHLSALPTGEDMERVQQLAEQLTDDLPRGWPQIMAIEDYLRNGCTLDRSATVSADVSSPVEDFLLHTRRGPEYLFATSAAVLLRSIGYSTRVVSGFYAHPDRYDAARRNTPVYAKDAHVWCEVCIGASTWLTLEPSPGYQLLKPPPNLWEKVMRGLHAAWRLLVRQSAVLLAAAVVLILIVARRRFLEDRLRTLRWRFIARGDSRNRAAELAELVDHRLRLAGLPRRAGTTLRRWANQPELNPVRGELKRLAHLADQAAFSRDRDLPPVEPGELNRLVSKLSFQELRRLNQKAADLAG